MAMETTEWTTVSTLLNNDYTIRELSSKLLDLMVPWVPGGAPRMTVVN